MAKRLFFIFFISAFLWIKPLAAKTLSYIPENPEQALIVIHGYGGQGGYMSWMTNRLKTLLPHTAFYYPTAPDDAPMGGKQWFAIPVLGERIREKSLYDKMMQDALRNVEEIHRLVAEIHSNYSISYDKIYVSGFSQGGLMALLTVLTNPNHLAKAISFSGVPLLYTPDFTPQNIINTPDILLIQGTNDRIIPDDSLKLTTETLLTQDIEPMIRVIKGMGHQINSTALGYLVEFLNE